jgi:predicted transposase YdaD
MNPSTDDYDTPWKDALTRYFPEFMEFYFADAHREIDWARPHVFLEQELAQVVRDAELGRRRVDKLVRVFLRDGAEQWVFVHIDVQGRYEKQFAERVFVYNYRIYDCYRRPVASLVLLADNRAHWKPASFGYKLLGCEVGIRFPAVKLNDYAERVDDLLALPNVFALVTAAHLLTQQTKGQHVKRHAAKMRLARMLYERDWDRQRIVDLFGIIDWMMRIPRELQSRLMADIARLEKERGMPYLNSFERAGLERGRQEGRQEGRLEGRQQMLRDQLVARFGTIPPLVDERLARAGLSDLTAWSRAVLDAPNIESVFAPR